MLIEMIELINKVVSVHEDESVLMLIESPDTVGNSLLNSVIVFLK